MLELQFLQSQIYNSYFNEEEKVVELLNELTKMEESLYIFVDSFENVDLNDNFGNLFNMLINFSNKNVHFVFRPEKTFLFL